MNRPVQRIRSDAGQILALLDQGFPFSLGPEQRKSILEEAGSVLHRLEAIEHDVLSIGLLGGTGVGKSTLMNALAGSRIASASHRRPHTDRILIYRHEQSGTLPFPGQSKTARKEITHGVDLIRRIVLCDLPDFDSMAAEHAELVLGFLESLDVLVWVTSLEKYGDARFYEFLKAAPKAKRNFVFVLNKLDLLFQGSDQEGYEQLERTVTLFRDHLLENGVDEPLLYAMAAQQALDSERPGPWNQFPLFRQYIFQQRDAKEIREIRSANLDAELRGIFSVMERESAHIKAVEQFVEAALQGMESKRSAWRRNAAEAATSWLSREWKSSLLLQQGESAALVGPGFAMDLLLREWRRMMRPDRTQVSESPSPVRPEGLLALLRSQIEEVRDGITRQMLVQGLPSAWLDRTESVLNVPGRLERFQRSLVQSLSFPGAAPASRFRGFRLLQYLAYAALFFLFLVAIGGGDVWEGIIAHPSLSSGLRLLVSWINTLFSGQGLAALGSYILLSFYLGYRFFRRHKRVMEKKAGKKAMQEMEALLQIWETQIQSLEEDLDAFRSDLRSKIRFFERQEE